VSDLRERVVRLQELYYSWVLGPATGERKKRDSLNSESECYKERRAGSTFGTLPAAAV
jgi:hypothetical protein